MLLNSYCDQLKQILKNCFYKVVVTHYDITAKTRPFLITNVLFFLKNSTYSQFKVLSDIIVYDHPGKKKRFTIVYNLLSVKYNTRFMLHICSKECESVPSVTTLYSSAI